MIIEKEIKEPIKKQRLDVLKRRHFELELDLISFEAVYDIEKDEKEKERIMQDIEATKKRMENIMASYKVIEAIIVE